MSNNTQAPHRVAIYYAPAVTSEWWRAGSAWLGRDAASHAPAGQIKPRDLSTETFRTLTAEPRRYGWHATLKAPFQLAAHCSLDQLCAEVQKVCRNHAPFEMPTLQVTRMGDFLALRPIQTPPKLSRLASDCVQQLHPWAAPLSTAELARRRRVELTPEQDALLVAWGYPWVMTHFRFHLSLTGSLKGLSTQELQALLEAAAEHFHRLPPCTMDRLSIFVEPAPGADFSLYQQLELQA